MRSAIFVDAGFLLSVGSSTITGTSLRASTTVDTEPLIRGILRATAEDSGLDPLRLYWYDAARHGVFTEEHRRIALLDDVKVRLGRLGVNGQQKGVDLRLGLDLVEIARNGAARTAYLLTGDDDLAEAVEAAQDLGMRVVLMAVASRTHRLGWHSVAEHLALQVDRIIALPQELIEETFRPVSRTAAPSAAPRPHPPLLGASATPSRPEILPTPGEVAARSTPPPLYSTSSRTEGPSPAEHPAESLLDVARTVAENAARSWYGSTTMQELEEVVGDRPFLPADIDGALLRDCAEKIGTEDTSRQSVRRHLREVFWETIDQLH
ncbi:NYN domain-containing protein [Brachybacterium hainanense]|uniref:NYN domain-containing protein n=1 Tax=Brachybacterium hainanense TaxID=1541174 RepID=A0ABV6RB25_9MICO